MSDQQKMSIAESKILNDRIDAYEANPPKEADPIMDQLDLRIKKSEIFPTWENTNALMLAREEDALNRQRELESRKRFSNQSAMADLDALISDKCDDQQRFSRFKKLSPADFKKEGA